MQKKASSSSFKDAEDHLKSVPDYTEIKESITESEKAVGINDDNILLIYGVFIILSVLIPLIYYSVV